MFRHSPLARDPPHVRLIRFRQPEGRHPVTSSHLGISLDIKHETLDRSSGAYLALSYVWGDATMNAVDIEVDGRHFSIGRNLHEALVVLRSNEEFCQSWIWVDSICIQQGNDAEKTVQVALMGDIFRQASMVCSWLGTSSSEIDAAMDCISKLGTRAFEAGVLEPNAEDLVHRSGKFWEDYTSQVFAANDIDDEVDDATRLCRALCEFYSNLKLDDLQEQEQIAKGLGSFLSKDYWHRVWITQEVALNNNTLLFCGNKVLLMEAFEAFFRSRTLLQEIPVKFANRPHTMSGIFKKIPANSGDMTALEVRRNRHHGSPICLSSLLVQFDVGPGRPHYSATDPRDIVFGLLGIISDKEQLGLRADYTQTTSQVLTTLTRALFESDKNRCFLLENVVPRSMDDPNPLCLPSWVQDWPKMGSGKTGREGWAVGSFDTTTERRYGPRHVPASQEITRDPAVLTRQGCYVDTVVEVMSLPQYDCHEWSASWIRDTPAWLSSVAEFARLSPEIGPSDDFVWRTLLKKLPLPVPNNTKSTGDSSRAWIHRHVMRRICPRSPDLPESVADDLRKGLYYYPFLRDPDIRADLDSHLEFLATHLPRSAGAYNRGRTLFKTEKGMFGAGRDVIQPGDIVTLIRGVGSPIVLQPLSSETGDERFWFKGDAYVDGIMWGEFLETKPSEKVFHIV